MNNYKLTEIGYKILNDRSRLLANPVLTSYAENPSYDNDSIESSLRTPLSTYDVRLTRVQDRLIFIFNLKEIDFSVNYQSFTLGFKSDLSREESENDLDKLIYINADNCFSGIVDQTSDEDITKLRFKNAQFRYGTNSIIIKNIFRCNFVNSFNLENDLGISSNEQLAQMFPYYKKI